MLEHLFITFIVIVCIQFIYYIFIYGSFSFYKNIPFKNNFNQPISIFICAKNDAKNLPSFLKQRYSNFELILINDCSNENTLKVIEQFKKESKVSIKIVDVSDNEQF